MNINISIATIEQKSVLRNMMELYFYDMSEFDDETDRLELDKNGLYGYSWLDYYWVEYGRFPYLMTIDSKLAGFALIREVEPQVFSVAEFFVVRKYRKMGVGSVLINEMFKLHKSKWIISTPIKNIVAQSFWRKSVRSASAGKYAEYLIEDGRRMEWAFGG
ncbi:MAG: GNAT family N-acetyltransferase [Defluviitaleaceae bacterium]|nr:GNAT family N-acetyltransferase [Defluviitaleaceae bacterium]